MTADAGPARVLSGRYRLGPCIGKGGMGVVHAGTDLVLDRPVAIKLLYPLADPVAQERFLREAKTTAKVRHPGIVEVFDFGTTGDKELFLVMEMLEGTTLSTRIAEGPLTPAECARLGADIAHALGAAHAEGVIHRDLKAGNVMLVRRGDSVAVKLLDFGIAKNVSSDGQTLTAEGHMIGTVDAMAPEQILGEAVDARTDVYALGCLLYFAVTGHKPFEGHTPAQIIHKHVSTLPEPPSTWTDVPASFDAVVLRCLEKDPAARFSSMRELAAALLAASGVEVAQAGPAAPAAPAVPEVAPGAQAAPSVALARAAPSPPSLVPDLELPRPSSPRRAEPAAQVPPPAPPSGLSARTRELDSDDEPVSAPLDLAEVARPVGGPVGPTVSLASVASAAPSLADERICATCGAGLARYALSCAACGGTSSVVRRADDASFSPIPARAVVHEQPVVWRTLDRLPASAHGAILFVSAIGLLVGLTGGHTWLALPLVVPLVAAALGLYSHARS